MLYKLGQLNAMKKVGVNPIILPLSLGTLGSIAGIHLTPEAELRGAVKGGITGAALGASLQGVGKAYLSYKKQLAKANKAIVDAKRGINRVEKGVKKIQEKDSPFKALKKLLS